jgi:hypothetical protein
MRGRRMRQKKLGKMNERGIEIKKKEKRKKETTYNTSRRGGV